MTAEAQPPAATSAEDAKEAARKAAVAAARARYEASKKSPSEKFLGLFPLDVVWRQQLGSAPAVWPGYDDTTAYVPLKTNALVAVGVQDGVVRWTADDVPVVRPPIADSGRVYLVGEGTLDARNAATGDPLWRVATKGTVSAPLVARGGWVILTLETGEVRALKGETGEEVWQIALGGLVKTEPLIVGERLYLAPEGSLLMAIDILTGKTAWERDMGTMVNSIAAHGDTLTIGTIGRMLIGLDEKRGQMKWKWRIGGDVIGRPAFDDKSAFVITMDNSMRAFDLKDGSQRWREPLEFRPLSGPTRIGDVLLVSGFSPALRGYSTKDGKRVGALNLPIGERSAPAAPPHYYERPLFIDDLIVTPTLDGELIALRRLTFGPITPLNPVPGTAAPAPTLPDASSSTTPTAPAAAPATTAAAKPPAG